ncbi:uncharacterized protein LTR77_001437 [Saxophila tyrrhenica]|uniref:Uncharacterized protein n=1 Tax=Saxophila tyrrhenica TaxID=1690608 RepID=A0AAV9PPX2_9PEZI|nr:hypothetical protein LTR77_001437 [Saxophila tyrrhenica]
MVLESDAAASIGVIVGLFKSLKTPLVFIGSVSAVATVFSGLLGGMDILRHPMPGIMYDTSLLGDDSLTKLEGGVDFKAYYPENAIAHGCWKESPEIPDKGHKTISLSSAARRGLREDQYHMAQSNVMDRPDCRQLKRVTVKATLLVEVWDNVDAEWDIGRCVARGAAAVACASQKSVPVGQFTDSADSEWVMELNDDTIESCLKLLPPEQKPKLRWHADDGPEHTWHGDEWNSFPKPDLYRDLDYHLTGPAYPQPPPNLKPVERRANSPYLELKSLFSAQPHPDDLDDTIGEGAMVLHKHMSTDAILRARALHTAMSTIMDARAPPSTRWLFFKPKTVSKIELVKSLHDRVAEDSTDHDKRGLEALSTGAVVRAVRERLQAGNVGEEEMHLADWVITRVRGGDDK